jgi:hypothetical protein
MSKFCTCYLAVKLSESSFRFLFCAKGNKTVPSRLFLSLKTTLGESGLNFEKNSLRSGALAFHGRLDTYNLCLSTMAPGVGGWAGFLKPLENSTLMARPLTS